MKCQTGNCDREANTRVFWPGREPLGMCIPCAARAQRVGDAMGCYIGIEEMREPEVEVEVVAVPGKEA